MEFPKRAIIETEYTCNLECKMCSLWHKDYAEKRNQKTELSIKKLEKIYKNLKELSIRKITFIGGEPFLKNYLIEAASLSRKYGLIPSVVTNGTLLNKEKIKHIVENEIFENIIFSVDGPEKIHNEIRGKKIFNQVYSNLILFRNIKNKLKKKKPRIMIYITLWIKNYKYLNETVKILSKVNPNKIRIQLASFITQKIIDETDRVIPDSLKIHSYQNNLSISENILKEIKTAVKEVKENYPHLNIDYEKILIAENKKCHFINTDTVITPNGDILVCPMLTNYIAGNIYSESLKKIWIKNYIKIQELKKLAESKKLPVCLECCVEKIR